MKKLVLLTLSSLLVSACTAIPVKTLYKLATTDPLTLDPVVMRVAARMPDWIEPRPDGAKLEITTQLDGKTDTKETFILQSIPLALAQTALAKETKAGFQLYTYRINPNDIPRLLALREKVKARKAAGIKEHGTMGISVAACRKGELREGAIPISNYLSLNPEEGYLPVLVDYDLRKPVKGQNLAEQLPAC